MDMYWVNDISISRGYTIRVNYDLRFRSDLKEICKGFCRYVNQDITTGNFPTMRTGEKELGARIISFDSEMIVSEILDSIYRMGYRPAELYDLVVFNQTHPENCCRGRIMALGSLWLSRDSIHSGNGCFKAAYSSAENCLGVTLDLETISRNTSFHHSAEQKKHNNWRYLAIELK